MKNVRRKTDGTLVNTNLIKPVSKAPSPPSPEDLEYGKHGTQARTEYENVKSLHNLGMAIITEVQNRNLTYVEMAETLGIKESTIINAALHPDKATVNVLMKILNYFNNIYSYLLNKFYIILINISLISLISKIYLF